MISYLINSLSSIQFIQDLFLLSGQINQIMKILAEIHIPILKDQDIDHQL